MIENKNTYKYSGKKDEGTGVRNYFIKLILAELYNPMCVDFSVNSHKGKIEACVNLAEHGSCAP